MKFRTMTVADMLEGFTDNMSQKQMDKELELFQNIADTLKITGRDYSSLGVLIDEDYMVENETINNLEKIFDYQPYHEKDEASGFAFLYFKCEEDAESAFVYLTSNLEE